MRAGFVVNSKARIDVTLTTYQMAASICCAGHEVWFISPGRFALDANGELRAYAYGAPERRYRSTTAYLAALDGPDLRRSWIAVESLDLLWLRCNPFALKDWAREAVQDFALLAAQRGVTVVNDPIGLAHASSKLYVEAFPREIRPRSLITRSLSKIERFLAEEGTIVLKPARGFGGRGVFKASRENRGNLGKIVRTLSRDGYVIAQEYLPASEQGDTRVFLLNGRPLEQDGAFAIVQRVRTGTDLRNNVHAGGEARPATMNDAVARVAELARPRLTADGMYFVGLDIVGDRLLEVNVFSPGGLTCVDRLQQADFHRVIARDIERKVGRIRETAGTLSNTERAML